MAESTGQQPENKTSIRQDDVALDGIFIRPIAHIRTDYPQKFGIPRQSGLVSLAQGVIVFEPEFAQAKAVQGLDEFTHLWLLWHFENGRAGGGAADVASDAHASNPELDDGAPQTLHASAEQALEQALSRKWSATVRPPRLGGAARKGVFATRSPFRPNPIGLSCVKLDHVELAKEGPLVYVLGADLRDGTAIFDIKPYLPLADCQPQASGGFTDALANAALRVDFPHELLDCVPAEKRGALLQVLENDPRPVGAEDPARVYTLAYAGFEVRFCVKEQSVHVLGLQPIE